MWTDFLIFVREAEPLLMFRTAADRMFITSAYHWPYCHIVLQLQCLQRWQTKCLSVLHVFGRTATQYYCSNVWSGVLLCLFISLRPTSTTALLSPIVPVTQCRPVVCVSVTIATLLTPVYGYLHSRVLVIVSVGGCTVAGTVQQ